MVTVVSKAAEIALGPRCDQCGAETRLFGIEAHHTSDYTDLRTYLCTQCDAVLTQAVPLRHQ